MAAQLRLDKKSHRLLAVPEALAAIWRNEGALALWKGLTLSWMKAPVAVALSFTINDRLKTFGVEYNEAQLDPDLTRGAREAKEEKAVTAKKQHDEKKGTTIDHVESHDKEHLIYTLARESSLPKIRDVPTEVPPTEREQAVVTPPPQHPLSFSEKFIAGGVAGAVAKTVIAPGDRVKILYQVSRCSCALLCTVCKWILSVLPPPCDCL